MKLRVKEYVVLAVALAAIVFAFVFAFNGSSAGNDFGREKTPPAKAAPANVSGENESGRVELPPELSLTAEISPAKAIPATALSELSVPAAEPVVPANASGKPAPVLARVPVKAPRPATKNFSCAGQICIDAETGKILSGRNANVRHPPASVTKLMTIFLVLDAVKAGKIELSTPVKASQRAQNMGGTQVHLAAGEVNSVDDLLYALMLQSANDAAVALAEKVSGSVEDFVLAMNAKARELGLSNTKFSTPHGLPVSKKERASGKLPDMTSAADLAELSRALIKTHPGVFRYSAAKTKMFRELSVDRKPLPMGNHNTLLRLFPGCDGLKTGWTNAGASIVTTASRGNRRVIAVVLGGIVPGAQKGSVDAKTSQRERNQRAAELMFEGLKKLDALKYEPTPEQP
ncbi:MAG: D-alanyl-D-alanine carboxypeptidase [Opitutales bacterium]|nr:D-alanyl-D-alanine carboxypeptidase [Opitutales bacterium]